MTGLYLLHFDPPYQHAGHYLGFAADVERRVGEHLRSTARSSPLVRAAIANGSTVTVARTWPGATRTFERRLKDRKCGPRLCPICRSDVLRLAATDMELSLRTVVPSRIGSEGVVVVPGRLLGGLCPICRSRKAAPA